MHHPLQWNDSVDVFSGALCNKIRKTLNRSSKYDFVINISLPLGENCTVTKNKMNTILIYCLKKEKKKKITRK